MILRAIQIGKILSYVPRLVKEGETLEEWRKNNKFYHAEIQSAPSA